MKTLRRGWSGILLGWASTPALLLAAEMPAHALRLEPSNVMLSYDVVAVGLEGPAGMAVRPQDGLLYIAERDAGRIARVRDKTVERVVESGFEVDSNLPDWALAMGRDAEFWREPRLREPSGVAFDSNGAMFVAEAGVGGRLLEFPPFEGRTTSCRVLSNPWMHGDYAYGGLAIDTKDTLYLTARRSRTDTALPTGSALLREAEGQWWMVDYGPFSEFAAPVVDTEGRFLLLVDRRSADVVWYHRDQQLAIGSMTDLEGLRHAAVLSDGTTLAALEREDGTWSLVVLDPQIDVLREWVGGLSAIGGLCVDPRTDEVYIALANEGQVARVRRMTAPQGTDNALDAMYARFRIEKALPPPVWPEFFKTFIEDTGVVEAINDRKQARSPERKSLTLAEFTQAIPLIAGKAKATLLDGQAPVADPVTEVSFVLFLPNKSMFKDGTLTPSISLFFAEHQSGHKTWTRFLGGNPQQGLSPEADWEKAPMALVSFPSGFQALDSPFAEPGHVRVYFVGMGLGPDYHILLHQADPTRGEMLVEGLDGKKARYRLETYGEKAEAGGQTLLVADSRIETPGWRTLAEYPLVWTIVVDEPANLNLRHTIPMEEMFAHDVRAGTSFASVFERKAPRKDLEWRRKLILNAAGRWPSTHF